MEKINIEEAKRLYKYPSNILCCAFGKSHPGITVSVYKEIKDNVDTSIWKSIFYKSEKSDVAKQFNIVMNVFKYELSLEECAESFGLNISTIRSNINSFIKSFREYNKNLYIDKLDKNDLYFADLPMTLYRNLNKAGITDINTLRSNLENLYNIRGIGEGYLNIIYTNKFINSKISKVDLDNIKINRNKYINGEDTKDNNLLSDLYKIKYNNDSLCNLTFSEFRDKLNDIVDSNNIPEMISIINQVELYMYNYQLYKYIGTELIYRVELMIQNIIS